MSISDFTKNLKQQLQESYCASDNKERNRNNKQQQKKSQTAHMWSSLQVKWLLSFPSLTVPAVHILAFAKLQVTTFQWPFLCVLNSWNWKLYIYQCQEASIYFPLHMWIFFEKFKAVNLWINTNFSTNWVARILWFYPY